MTTPAHEDTGTVKQSFGTTDSQSYVVPSGLANSILAVRVMTEVAAVSGITYNGVALTKKSSVAGGNAPVNVELWYLLAPPAGAHTLAVTLVGGTNRNFQFVASTYSAVDQVTPFGTAATGGAHDGDAPDVRTVSVVSASGELVIDVFGSISSANDPTDQSSHDGVRARTHSSVDQFAAGDEAGVASTTMSWKEGGASSADWGLVGVALKPVSDITPPGAATSCTAAQKSGSPKSALTLGFTPPAGDVTQYEIRGADGATAPATRSDGTQIAAGSCTASNPVSGITDASLPPGQQRSYRVFLADAVPNWNDGAGATATATTKPEQGSLTGVG